MSIMTAEQYNERKGALTSAIAHAEGEFQSAAFKEITGSGSADAGAKAKEHLSLLREELVKIEAAWVASQEEIARLHAKSIADGFDAVSAEIDSLFAARKEALRDVMKATEAVITGLSCYQNATDAIRKKAMSVVKNTGSDKTHWVSGPMENNVAAKASSAILSTAHILLGSGPFMRDAFPNGDPIAFEDNLARNVRAVVKSVAPKDEVEAA